MVRMVHVKIFYKLDLYISDSKSEFWTKTEKIGRSKIEKWKNENPKSIDVEFYNEIGSSGPSHSIRLVKLVSKNSTRAKVNDMFGPKINFLVKNQKNRLNSLTSIGLPGFYILTSITNFVSAKEKQVVSVASTLVALKVIVFTS